MSRFAKPSEFTGGAYFKPLDHMNDVALLVEPKRIDKNVENTYGGQTRTRDEVTATVSVFATSEALEEGRPSAVMGDVRVVHGMLTSTLERLIGGAMVGVIRRVQTKSGSGYVFRDVEPGIEAQVAAYFDNRSAAVAAMPSFD